MGINLRLNDNDGNMLAQVSDGEEILSKFLGSVKVEHTVCLRFVDPDGDTIFNQRQIPVLIEELESLGSLIRDRLTGLHLEKVLALTREGDGLPGAYVWFYAKEE